MNKNDVLVSAVAEKSEIIRRKGVASLAVASLGVVYGDIGTSPLYAMKEIFSGTYAVSLTPNGVFGVLSLIFWSMMIVISLKYVIFIMRADNQGEGGIMALMALVLRTSSEDILKRRIILILGLFGVALFFGDSMITPAISVLSAVEGLEVAAPALSAYVIPLTIAVLIGLFLFQRKGTAGIASLFGPIMCFWFIGLATLGIINIVQEPAVLQALNPLYAASFFIAHKWYGFLALGAVFLALTGAEALYADMGHFGCKPIRVAWFWLVFPALILNYFGQGALLIQHPAALQNPFYLLAPSWALYPMIIVATLATVIASQAVISGAFSLGTQAMKLSYTPRLHVIHTSEAEIGQIYVPIINWVLFIAIVALVLTFKSSTNLASAYGMSVAGTMVITTILAFVVVRNLWKWSWILASVIIGFFLIVDVAFFSANLTKFIDGGWVPLVMGIVIFSLMSTWKKGRDILLQRLREEGLPLENFIASIGAHPPPRVPGMGVFMSTNLASVPHALLHNLAHNKVLHERVILLKVVTKDIPWVSESERLELQHFGNEFYSIIVRYGFMDNPDIPKALEQCRKFGFEYDLMSTSFFLSRETLIATERPGMALWREKLFVAMARNASSATAYFNIPTNRVIELGTQVEL